MLQITTASGSTGQIDPTRKVARYLKAADPAASTRLTPDWRPYSSIQLAIGESLRIIWTLDTPLLPGNDCGVAATFTSPVVQVENIHGEHTETPP